MPTREEKKTRKEGMGEKEGPLHVAVLLKEVVAQFEGRHIRSFVDCTLGAGGHASAIIEAHPELHTFIGLDVDPVAHEEARSRLEATSTSTLMQLNLVRTNFRNFQKVLRDVDARLAQEGVDGVLMDLGMSSMQVNIAERGFSFLRDGPADMRMDPSVRTILPFTMQAIPTYGVRCSDDSSESLLFDASARHQHVVNALVIVMELQASLRADEILNKWSELEVGRILREYGEERRWRQLARKIVEARLAGGIQTTSQLVGVIGGSKFSSNSSGKQGRMKGLHPATRTFQALRIAVNDELRSLEVALSEAFASLAPKGRLAVISFHSLEDRIVKHFFLKAAGLSKSLDEEGDAHDSNTDFFPALEYVHIPGETRHSKYRRKKGLETGSGVGAYLGDRNVLEGKTGVILTKRPVVATSDEINTNPRSRSAKLRVIEKL